MKPLIIIPVFNRRDETDKTLRSLVPNLPRCDADIVAVDNGSTDGATAILEQWESWGRITVESLEDNIGCPRALNLAIERHRRPGQPVVKVDNDVLIKTPWWIESISDLVKDLTKQGRKVAMIGAWYDGVTAGRVAGHEWYLSQRLWNARIVIGHCVWHTGAFMDAVGYFDVLDDDHLYGFEDLLMSVKVRVMGWESYIWEGWRIENIQRHNSLGDGQSDHVARMRPLYDERVTALWSGGSVRTGRDGRPETKNIGGTNE